MHDTTDIAVVGGGIVGTSSAYYLARRGADVTLFEQSHIGAGTTGSGGGIRTQYSTPTNVKLSLESKRIWDNFESEFDSDIRTRRIGYLLLAREQASAERLERDVEMQNAHGANTQLLAPDEIRSRCAGIEADHYRVAAHSPDDLFVDPHLALQAYAGAARDAGARMEIGTEVTDIERTGSGSGRVTRVETSEGSIDTDYVVNAAGPWAARVAALADVDIPIRTILRRLLYVQPDGEFDPMVPLSMDVDTGSVFYPVDESVMVVSGHYGEFHEVDPDGYNDHIDLEWTSEVIEGVAEMADYFGPETTVQNKHTGVYAVTPDQNPIVGETVPGLINAVGFSGHGFMHAPATGKLVAELALDGAASLLDIESLAADRFAEGGADGEESFI